MQGRLDGRLIALGVTGSIAAYKAVELLRLLTAEGADVVVLLSPSATRFVGPLSFAALSRHPVESELMELLPDGRIGHIVIADTADAIVVAPATAHWLGAMAAGLSGDVVTATCLATSAPVIAAPAMDGDMWRHPATSGNVERLRTAFGYTVVEPGSGPLASGQSGIGRLADLPLIVDAVVEAVAGRPVRAPDPAARPPRVDGNVREPDLVGRHIVVTAGGTREPIDPVRYIGNRSSGRMGTAMAEAALDRGARVTLIAAATSLPLPDDRATIMHVETTDELRAALLATLFGDAGERNGTAAGERDGTAAGERDGTAAGERDGTAAGERDAARGIAPDRTPARFDALVMAAAVSDFRPTHAPDHKIERAAGMTLELESTPDLLAEVARITHGLDNSGAETRRALVPAPVLVGFAAETGSLDRAPGKLRRKGLDLLVANDVTEPDSGFGTETNRVVILDAEGGEDGLPLLTKREVADRILDRVVGLMDARARPEQTGAMSEVPR